MYQDPAQKTTEKQKEGSDFFENYQEFEEWRAVFYKLAWLGLSYPGESLAEAVYSGKFFQGMKKTAAILRFEQIADDNLDDLASHELSEKTLQELETEYVSLFISDLGGALVPPYGSVYLDNEVMGPSTRRVAEKYRKAGFKKDSGHDDLPDHISVELEYLFKLTQKENRKKYHLHLEFFDELLAPWVEEFTGSVRREADSGFYSTLAGWLNAGLKRDRQFLKEMVKAKDNNAETDRGFK